MDACRELGLDCQLTAINHWAVAIDTHSTNHPNATHICEDLQLVDPMKAVPGGRLRILLASPECTHHSNARGGKPMSDQSRATAWHVLWWAEKLQIDNILIENVREFRDWGPIGADGRPVKSMKGRLFRQFISTLRGLGYTVDHRILCSADYGDATTRKRLFIQARKGRRKITWPEPTHFKADALGLFPDAQKWRSAREIINWDKKGESIYTRKKPLAPKTMARIFAGLQRYSGLPFIVPQFTSGDPKGTDAPLGTITTTSRGVGLAEPCIVVLRNNQDTTNLDDPISTICGSGAHHALIEPCIVGAGGPSGMGRPQSINDPLGTVIGENHRALIEPFIIPGYQEREGQAPRTHDIDAPVPTVCAQGWHAVVEPCIVTSGGPEVSPASIDEPLGTLLTREHKGLVEPCIVPITHSSGRDDRVHSVDEPLPTVTTSKGGEFALADGFLVAFHNGPDGDRRTKSVDEPVPTLDTSNRYALAEPVLIKYYEGSDGAPIDAPVPSITANYEHIALCEPFLVVYQGRSDAADIDLPLPTCTSRDRIAIVHPDLVRAGHVAGKGEVIGWLDIRFRMLMEEELAAAMSYDDYVFKGTREQVVKQIGNGVTRKLAKALCMEMLR